jgi:hypothetical protein
MSTCLDYYTEEYIYKMWKKHYSEVSTFDEHLERYFIKKINTLYTMIDARRWK